MPIGIISFPELPALLITVAHSRLPQEDTTFLAQIPQVLRILWQPPLDQKVAQNYVVAENNMGSFDDV
jgi:hypothetical protein